MKKNMNEISGKTLNQKEMQEIKGGAPLCPTSCYVSVPDSNSKAGYHLVLSTCFYSYGNQSCTCEAGGGQYQGPC